MGLALVFSLLQIQNEQCRIACLYEGYTGGAYRQANCRCYQEIDYEAATKPKFKIRLEQSFDPPSDMEYNQDYDSSLFRMGKLHSFDDGT